ncbi:unnamed protein product, partial [Meganyctiphanes norvegica]
MQQVPPSRPSINLEKPQQQQPNFHEYQDVFVVGAINHDVYLHCRVNNLGDRSVTWMRKKDTHILTVSLFTYTTDQRFTALHSESSDQWSLRIASAQKSDSGIYECQVSTEPKISAAFTLQVV